MKPSHLQTPRSLAECQFVPGYISHDYHDDHVTWTGMFCRIAAAIAILAAGAAWLGVLP